MLLLYDGPHRAVNCRKHGELGALVGEREGSVRALEHSQSVAVAEYYYNGEDRDYNGAYVCVP